MKNLKNKFSMLLCVAIISILTPTISIGNPDPENNLCSDAVAPKYVWFANESGCEVKYIINWSNSCTPTQGSVGGSSSDQVFFPGTCTPTFILFSCPSGGTPVQLDLSNNPVYLTCCGVTITITLFVDMYGNWQVGIS